MNEPPPIREAIIVAEAGDPLRAVARVPLLVRTILALQRAGVERCTLVGSLSPPADARIRCALATAPALTPPADDALRLVMGADTVIDPTLVRDLQARARPGQVLEVEADGAWVRVAPGPLVAGNGGTRLGPGAGTLRRAGSAGLEQALLRGLENPRDGYLDRLLRRLSRPLTRLTLGVAGGLLLGVPGVATVVAAIVLLEASAVLDCSDGEIARLRFAESRLGHWLDVTGDTVVHVAVLAGIARRVALTGSAPGWPLLTALLLGVLGAFAMITWSDATEARRRRVAAWENQLLDGVLSPLTTRDWHVFPVVFALAGRRGRGEPVLDDGARPPAPRAAADLVCLVA